MKYKKEPPIYVWEFRSRKPRAGRLTSFLTSLYADGELQCDCPAWVIRKRNSRRTCRHVLSVRADSRMIINHFQEGMNMVLSDGEVKKLNEGLSNITFVKDHDRDTCKCEECRPSMRGIATNEPFNYASMLQHEDDPHGGIWVRVNDNSLLKSRHWGSKEKIEDSLRDFLYVDIQKGIIVGMTDMTELVPHKHEWKLHYGFVYVLVEKWF